MSKVTITISGPIGTGKTFIQYAINRVLKKKLGLNVKIDKSETLKREMYNIKKNKKNIKKVLKDKGIIYEVCVVNLKESVHEHASK